MTIGLVVVLGDGTERDVEVEMTSGASVHELASALTAHLQIPPGLGLYLVREGAWVDDSETVGAAGLLHGDRIFIGPRSHLPPLPDPGPGSPDAGPELVVVGGTNIGLTWPLPRGSLRVGRARECDIAIDDPALSRTHLALDVEPDGIWVTDAGSTNGTFLNGVRLDARHHWSPGEIIEAGASLLSIEMPGGEPPAAVVGSSDGRLLVNRPPRVSAPAPALVFDVPAAPSDTTHPRLPLAAAAVPLLIALILWRLFPDNPGLLVIMALSPVMVVFSYLEDRRRGTRGARRSEREWRASLGELVDRISSARDAYAAHVRDRSPAAAELRRRARARSANLWERRRDDPDFLLLRCGWGDGAWPMELRRTTGAHGGGRDQTGEQLQPLKVLPSVPLAVDARAAGVIGLCGDLVSVEAAARWLIVQLATLHSPEDVSAAALVDADPGPWWRWVSWLPHLRHGRSGDSAVVEELVALIEARSAAETASSEGASAPPAVVVLIDGRTRAPRALLTRVLKEGPRVGIFVVWMAAKREDLPGETRAIVELTHREEATITFTKTGEQLRGAREGVAEDMCRDVALALAPLVDAAPTDRAQDLPREVSLYSLLEIEEPDAATVARAWASRQAALSVPIGVTSGGTAELDLVADGPHTLVAGTTGAGKSELLQTLVASLAWHYSPTQVNLLLIDYKGGAAFKDCAALPHTVGLVTDLDAQLSERALVSLEAELKRRERVLRDADARDISELDPTGRSAFPRLILMIDEFAALVKELPAFVDGIIDLAQRGRSLGIHLVLATQRPAGVINDAIRANTNLRIALRVADEGDSEDVVGTRDAAYIPRSLPGRALIKRGHGEIEHLQSAFSAAADAPADGVVVRDRLAPAGTAAPAAAAPARTQLQALAAAVTTSARDAGLPPPRAPWLPPLPATIPLQTLKSGGSQAVGVFGVIDRPELQRQDPATFDPSRAAGMVVYGATGSGKTTLLLTIAASLAARLPVHELHLYGLDFATGGLRALTSLPHCGEVVAGDDFDRVERAFALLRREIERRKSIFADERITSLDELPRVRGNVALPRIVVMLDGYQAFHAAFERVDMGELVDLLPRLVADGPSVGIHFLITAARRAAIPAGLASLLPTKIVLRMTDEDDYLSLGLDARAVKGVKLPPGRGYLEGSLLQVAIVGSDPSPEAQRAALVELGSRVGTTGEERPARIELLPSSVALASIEPSDRPLVASFGVTESDLATAAMDLNEGHLLVAGPYRSGRSTALSTIASMLNASTPAARLWLLAPRPTPLVNEGLWARVAVGAAQCEETLATVAADEHEGPLILFIDDADELAEGPCAYALEPLVKARGEGLRVVAAAETLALHRSFGGWLAELRKHKQGLLLDPDVDLDGDLLGVKLPRRQKRAFTPGRGYQVTRGRIELVQTARN